MDGSSKPRDYLPRNFGHTLTVPWAFICQRNSFQQHFWVKISQPQLPPLSLFDSEIHDSHFVSHQTKTISLLRKELFHHQNLQGQREFVEHLCETIYLVFEFELARFHELWTQIGCEPSNSVTVKLGEGKTQFFEQGKIDWFLFDWYDPETHCKFVSSNLFQTIKYNSSPRCVWSCLFWFRCYAWCSIFTVIWPILEVHFTPNLNPMVLISRIELFWDNQKLL